jgi:hypothetical protein
MNNSHLLAIMAGLIVIGLDSSPLTHDILASGLSPTNQSVGKSGEVYQEPQPATASSGSRALANQAKSPKEASDAAVSAVYPNPNTGYFVVQLPSSMEGKKGTIEVLNRGTRIIYSSDFMPENGNKIIVDMGITDPGMYFLIIRTADDRMMSKFFVK